MAAISIERVTKIYGGGVRAVDDVSLTVADGEFMVLVGPSGCGKSTLLRVIAGLEQVTGGRVSIGDENVTALDPADRDVAMVFQSYALYPHKSVRENLAFGLRRRHVAGEEISTRVDAMAAMLGLGELMDRKPAALSGGQRQRVAMGRALVREPRAFLMDEPLSNLDAKLRVQTRAEILRIQQRLGTTTVYVTHDQVEAMTMGDRIAVMSEGVLQQVGPPPELYMHPVNKFVAAFIGSPAMNFATVHADQGKLKMGNHLLHLTGSRAKIAQDRHGHQLEIGFRPEDLEIANGTGDGAVRFPAKIEVVEYLGNQELLHADAEGNEVLALVSSDRKVQIGDNVEFTIPTEKLHLFDPETEESLVPTS
jgi:multiple sugar transport system ATP-binding protein